MRHYRIHLVLSPWIPQTTGREWARLTIIESAATIALVHAIDAIA